MKYIGLIGASLAHSFSPNYFTKKLKLLGIKDIEYVLIDIPITSLSDVFKDARNFLGWNVTIPYKTAIIPYLDYLHINAHRIGAVNTILNNDSKKIGFNTDFIGFLAPFEKIKLPNKVLILGTGGAAKSVAYALHSKQINSIMVSRNNIDNDSISYQSLNRNIIEAHDCIINTTPLGMFPNINEYPRIPYEHINTSHVLYDLVYNPQETEFMRLGKKQGAKVINGQQMLERQAEESWNIWNAKKLIFS